MADFDAELSRVLGSNVAGFVSLTSCERLSGGASQETYRIVIETKAGARKLAMRRAPGGLLAEGTAEKPGLRLEAKLMQLARAAGVPEPEIVHVLEPEDGIGEGFIMEWLEGETLGARINRAPEFEAIRGKLAYQCGQLAARIHGIDLAATGLDKRLGRLEPEAFVRQKWEQYQLFETPQPMIDYTARWLLDHLPTASTELTLVHNDFRNGNLMVSPETGVTAVLDWEVAHIGDPMRDLGWICTNSWRFGADKPVGGFGDYDELFAGYESVSKKPVDRARVKFWEVFGSYWWAIGCLGMAFAYRNGPDRTVERPGIGRRSSECQVDCVNLLIPGDVRLPETVAAATSTDTPRTEELLESVRDFLRADVMSATEGRTNFLARVASNSLDIVLREVTLGPKHLAGEHERLQALLGKKDDLTTLRWDLVRRLRDGSMKLDHPGLAAHLRSTVVGQVAIDQPKYSGLRTALKHSGG